MEKRKLGQTDLELSVISFGASSLGHAFRPVKMEAGLEAVRAALDVGITHIDTSAFYGLGISEVLLGVVLRDVPRDQYTISTKLGRYGDDRFDFSPERVAESVDTSLFRLGVDFVDMVFLHDVEWTDYRENIDRALPALKREQEKGKVRYVGLAGYPFGPVRYAMERYGIEVTLNHNHYMLQNRRLVTKFLPELKAAGVGVLNASPFGQRLLTHVELPSWHGANEEVRKVCRQAVEHCHNSGVDPAKLCVQFSTRHPDMSTCIIGSGNPENIRKWAAWLEQPYETELIAEVEQILAPVLDVEAAYGLPENLDPT